MPRAVRTTQYFEILGNRAIYHDGWVAACFHGRLPWVRSQAVEFGEEERWELYRVDDDFSEGARPGRRAPGEARSSSRRCSTARPAPTTSTRSATRRRCGRCPHNRPSLLEGRTQFTLYRDHVRQPELATVNLKNTSFDLRAKVVGSRLGAPRASSSARAATWPAGRSTSRTGSPSTTTTSMAGC